MVLYNQILCYYSLFVNWRLEFRRGLRKNITINMLINRYQPAANCILREQNTQLIIMSRIEKHLNLFKISILFFPNATQKLIILFSITRIRKIGYVCYLNWASDSGAPRWYGKSEIILNFIHVHPSKLKGLEVKCKHAINGALQYASTFTCLIMASIWYKILSAINNVNLVIEARDPP